MLRIIDNKRIDLTNDEYEEYNAICKSYKQGNTLFKGLFETNDEGIIEYLHTPKKMFTMEVVLYLEKIMIHQHLRRIYKEHQDAMSLLNERLSEVDKLKKDLESSSSS